MKRTKVPNLSVADKDRVGCFKSHESWGISNPKRFKELMDEAASLVYPGFYLGDNMFTWMRNNSALDDSAFHNAWQSNITNPADEAVMWRRYILCCAAYHCVHLDGDFIECGVLFGAGVKTVIDFFGKDNFAKTFWAYDAFDTNPVETHPSHGQQAGLYKTVKTRFAGYDNVKLVKGLLPESLRNNSPQRVAYLHIDLNQAEHEIAVLNELFDRVVAGGVIIMDDYEWSSVYRDQKIKEDRWFEEREYRVFPLPTGQGLLIKR